MEVRELSLIIKVTYRYFIFIYNIFLTLIKRVNEIAHSCELLEYRATYLL